MPDNYYRVENQEHDADDLVRDPNSDVVVAGHRKLIEPWLSAIFQSEHLSLLLGSGFSIAVARAANVQPTSMATAEIDPNFDAAINAAAAREARSMGRGEPNLEDQLRAAVSLGMGLSVLGDEHAESFSTNLNRTVANFANSVIRMESDIGLAGLIDDTDELRYQRLLTGFLMSFASRTASRDRLHLFTTNYDRVIEHGFDLIGARPIDRFVGVLAPRFRASRFDLDIYYSPGGTRLDARPLEGVVRFTKLHGSIDWRYVDRDIVREAVPFGGPHTVSPEQANRLMVYPNSAKDIETAFFPYAELFRDFSAAVSRPNSTLVTYGYGFGDDHVNRIIRDMLTLPSTHLVILSFDDPGGRIARFIQRSGRQAQISLVIGPELAGLEPLVDRFLPKPAIDLITERQAELLDRRGQNRHDPNNETLA